MKGKVCVVTGASSGIGKEIAVGLARMHASVVMVCRNRESGVPALEEVKRMTGSDTVDLLTADLSSLSQVRALAEEFREKYARLDVLVNNAGIIPRRRTLTEDGLEMQFAVNHLAPFLLTNLLLDLIKASAPARIVNVASGMHERARMDFDDLQAERRYRVLKVYGRSKLANVLFTYELARRVAGTGVAVNCYTPGMTRTGLGRYLSGPMGWAFQRMGRSPAEGADTGIFLASSREVEGVTGKYFYEREKVKSSKLSHDLAVAGRLWEVSAELTGLK